jgi:hypothetical protein
MRGVYAHVSEIMRTEVTTALQIRWEESLRARAAMDPHSPVPLLDKLLAPYRTPSTPLSSLRSLAGEPARRPGRPHPRGMSQVTSTGASAGN